MATERQIEVLRVFARTYEERLPPPTLRELCCQFGWRSTGTARDHVKALARQGLLERTSIGASRNWRLTKVGLVLARR